MVTEVFSAPYSMIDPTTEAVQIAGRFRNGVSRLIHITNYNAKAKFWKREDREQFLNEQHGIYSIFRKLWFNYTAKGQRYILEQAMKKVDYVEFALSNGERNLFMYNNAFREDYIKMIYVKPSRILGEYDKSQAFNVNYIPSFFRTTDKDRRILNPSKYISQVELNKLAFEQMLKLRNPENEYDKEYYSLVAKSYKVICDGIAELGYDKIAELGYKTKAIEDAIQQSIINKQMLSTGVRNAVYKSFKVNTRYTCSEINDKLWAIFDRFGIKYKKSGCSHFIGLYFNIERNNITQNRGWMLLSRKY